MPLWLTAANDKIKARGRLTGQAHPLATEAVAHSQPTRAVGRMPPTSEQP
jgi:hypothetical protein